MLNLYRYHLYTWSDYYQQWMACSTLSSNSYCKKKVIRIAQLFFPKYPERNEIYFKINKIDCCSHETIKSDRYVIDRDFCIKKLEKDFCILNKKLNRKVDVII